MINVIRDASLDGDARKMGFVDVRYPAQSEWDIEGFEAFKAKTLDEIRAEGADYDRETVFRQHPYFRYYRKFKKSYPVMMQVESFLLKGRPFPEGEYINAVAFLTELKTHILLGTHDADCIEGPVVLYSESEKTPFTGMINPDSHSYPGDLTGRDDKGVIISMIAGADDRTCIHEDTDHVVYLIFALPDIAEATGRGTGDSSDEAAQDAAISAVADEIITAAKTLAPTAEIDFAIF